MKITWTEFATRSLKRIFDYYAENANRKVAHKIRKQILKSTHHLKKFPEIGQIEPNIEKLYQMDLFFSLLIYGIIPIDSYLH